MRRFSRPLIVAALAVAALLPAGVAQARPVPDEPSQCRAGYHVNHYGLCVRNTPGFGGGGHF